MKKSINILLIFMITFFTLPIGGITAFADEKTDEKIYDSIADGEYEIGVEALEEDSDKNSAADGFLLGKAKTSVQGEDIILTLRYTKDFDMDYGINWTKLEGNDPIEEDENDEAFIYTFQIDEINETYQAGMNYYVAGMPGDMGDKEKGHSVDYRIVLDENDLNELPEQPDEEKAPEEREEGQLLTEKEADAVYQLNYETDSESTEANLENPVKLLEKDNKEYVQIQVNDEGAQYFRSLKINEKEVTWNNITEGPYNIQFELPNGIEDELDLSMVIQAGPNVMSHDNIKLWFDKDSLETIKEPETKPEEDDEKAPEERKEGQLLTEKEADAVYELNFETDSKATEAQLDNPVKLLEKDNKEYVQISVAENGAQYFRSLKVNGEEVTWNSITEGPYNIQFELPNGIEDELELSMVIQAGPSAMPHDNIKLWFDEDSLETIKEPEPEEPESPEESELDPENLDEGVYTLDYTFLEKGTDNASAMDEFTEGPAYVKVDKDGNQFIAVTLTGTDMIQWFKVNGKDVKILQENEEEDKTRVIEFSVENLTQKQAGNIYVEVPGMYSTEHEVDLVFETDSLKSAKDNDYPEDQNVEQSETDEPDNDSDNPKDNDDPEEEEKPTKEPVTPTTQDEKSELVPDKAYAIDYVVKHETEDRASAADNFFEKPGHLLYLDDEKFIQLKINNWAMIDWLRTEHGGDVIVVKENDDGSALIQFKVEGELSEVINLSMSVTVPNVYEDKVHEARLILDLESKAEIDAADFRIIVDKKDNPEKPEFGDNNKETKTNGDTVTPDKADNPQTGDTTNIFLYAMLLIGSFIPLAVKLRRRFI